MIDNKQINDHLDHFQNLTSQRLNYQREKYFPICSLVASNYLKFLGKMKCCFVQVAYKKNRIQQFFFKIVILINIVSDTFVSKSLTLSAEIIFYKTLFYHHLWDFCLSKTGQNDNFPYGIENQESFH